MNETYLAHHGVKGMKWGVRKDRTVRTAFTSKSKSDKVTYLKSLVRDSKSKSVGGMSKRDYYNKGRYRFRQESLGKKAAQLVLMGPLGAFEYNRARYAGYTRAGAFVAAKLKSQFWMLPASPTHILDGWDPTTKMPSSKKSTSADVKSELKHAFRLNHSLGGPDDPAMDDKHLAHHGVKGMKWGVRKQRPVSGGSNGRKSLAYKLNTAIRKPNAKLIGANVTYKQFKQQGRDRFRAQSTGKKIALVSIFGPFGAMEYNRARSAGYTRLGAAICADFGQFGGSMSYASDKFDRAVGRTKYEADKWI